MHWQVSTPYLSSFFFFFKWETEKWELWQTSCELKDFISIQRSFVFWTKFSKDLQCIVIYGLEQNHKASETDLSWDCYCDLEFLFFFNFLLVNVNYAHDIKQNMWGQCFFFFNFIVPHFTMIEYFSKFDNTFQKLKCTYSLKRLEKEKMYSYFLGNTIIYLEISSE